MKPRNVIYTLLAVLVMLMLAINVFRRQPGRKELFDRTPRQLEYTRHARCRMDCRDISENDVREIMQKGVIHLNRSNRQDRPCPTYALQGRTTEGERLRVIFAQCPEETRVVTCYNLDEDPPCQCPSNEPRKETKKPESN